MSKKAVQDPFRDERAAQENARKDYGRCMGEYRSSTGIQGEPRYPTPDEVIAHSKGERDLRNVVRK